MFFDRVEPAYAFARAGRMSSGGDIVSCGVYEAAQEIRYTEDDDGFGGHEVRTLHAATDSSLREHADDQGLLARWVRWTVPGPAYYQPPGEKER